MNAPDLANRGIRLVARIVDRLIVGLPFFVVMVMGTAAIAESGSPEEEAGIIVVLIGLLTSAVLLVYQFYLLSISGQTIAKRWLGVRIVDIQSGKPGGFVQNVLLRGILNQILCIIPFYGLVDALFIFRADRCCIHDHLAGTRVVKT